MTPHVEKFIKRFKNLEVVEFTIPVNGSHGMFHRRIKNKDNARYHVDYWHTGKFRTIDGRFEYSGYEDKNLKAEIERLAAFQEKTTPIETVNTHGELITFGKHKGERWTRLPISYLKWLANESRVWRPMALAELKRRGTTIDATVEISGHAIDRASLYCRKIWHKTALENEGLNAWLVRIATEALEARGEKELIRWKGLKMIFAFGEYFPTLKTIMPYGKANTELKGARISFPMLVTWLTQRRNELLEQKEKAKLVDTKKAIGAKAKGYAEILGYIYEHVGDERDLVFGKEV